MLIASKRETKETSVGVTLEMNGAGIIKGDTGIEFLDEILKAFAIGSRFDLTVNAVGDRETGDHHTIEDTGITLGSALCQVAENGIGSSIVPSGQALALAAVRFGEPGYRGDFIFTGKEIGGMSLENFEHFLRALAYNGIFTLIIRANGGDDRSKIEAMSLALGRAIKKAAGDESIR